MPLKMDETDSGSLLLFSIDFANSNMDLNFGQNKLLMDLIEL